MGILAITSSLLKQFYFTIYLALMLRTISVGFGVWAIVKILIIADFCCMLLFAQLNQWAGIKFIRKFTIFAFYTLKPIFKKRDL